MTQTGSTAGTFDYMAPEQVEGGVCDERTDVYAFGVLAYEMLTGRVPRGNFDPPQRLRPEVPAALSATVMRALKARPEDRFANMDAVLKALPQISELKRGRAALLLLPILLLAVVAWFWPDKQAPESVSTLSPVVTLPAPSEAPQHAPKPWLNALAGANLATGQKWRAHFQ